VRAALIRRSVQVSEAKTKGFGRHVQLLTDAADIRKLNPVVIFEHRDCREPSAAYLPEKVRNSVRPVWI
jgi:hypothetical protein